MKFGLMFANVGPFASPEGATAIARAAEEAGFESVWTVEHVVIPLGYESEYPYDASGKMPAPDDLEIPDPLVWLTWVASQTTRLKLGTGILILPQRNPAITAKEVATLDRLSGGRVLLGVGAGWLEEEFRALGAPFQERGRVLDDHIEAMRSLWQPEASTYEGTYSRWKDVMSFPSPTDGRVPIIIGGHTKVAAKRAGRLGDGFFPGRGNREQLAALIETMREAAAGTGRDPDAIEITTGGEAAFAEDPVAALADLAELGISRVVVPPLAFDPASIGGALGRFGEDVIAKVS